MREQALGNYDQKVSKPARAGERAATFVDDYLACHPGLSLSELAFRIKADKRDVQRLVRERSLGWPLADCLAAYFGDDFTEALFRPVVGDGPSKRERELERERAEIAARRERLERDREARRQARAETGPSPRLVSDQGRRSGV